MRLSVLICTTSAREKVIQPLLKNLKHQINQYANEVEVIINDHETDIVGKKRNDLLKLANGTHVVFIDSDDQVSPHYIKLILKALRTDPDAVGISGMITTNGRNPRKWHISKDYGLPWRTENKTYLRTPNHISPIRREIALKAKFPDIQFAEDYEFSLRVFPIIKTEVKIKGTLYYYQYSNKKK